MTMMVKVASMFLLVVCAQLNGANAEGNAHKPLSAKEMARRMYSPFTRAARRISREAQDRVHRWELEQQQQQDAQKALRGARDAIAVHSVEETTPAPQVVSSKAVEQSATTTASIAPAVASTVEEVSAIATAAPATTVAVKLLTATTTVSSITPAASPNIQRASPVTAMQVASTTASASIEQPENMESTVDTSATEEEDDSDDDTNVEDTSNLVSDSLDGSAELVAPITALHSMTQQKSAVNQSMVSKAGLASVPCQCQAINPAWKRPTRTTPQCVFIDLGAADGNTFQSFVNNGYGPVANCPSGKWEALLVEANPHFNKDLHNLAVRYPNSVQVYSSTAAYMCEAQTSFFIDTVNTGTNFWGSSLSPNHPDVQKSGFQKVTVDTMNLNRLLIERTIPGDWVMVKMDIEGAEWEVVPCLAESPSAMLVDRLYLEEHPVGWGNAGTTQAQLAAAKAKLASAGVDIPQYFSHTL